MLPASAQNNANASDASAIGRVKDEWTLGFGIRDTSNMRISYKLSAGRAKEEENNRG
jgi:hypothetical protein